MNVLIVFDKKNAKQVKLEEFDDDREAIEAYNEAEREYEHFDSDSDYEVVLLGADSAGVLQFTHPGYFLGFGSDSTVAQVMGETLGLWIRENNVHTVPFGNRWANRRAGAAAPYEKFETKQAAVVAGRQQAEADRAEHIIHNRDGSIGERKSYMSNPLPLGSQAESALASDIA